jgi:hypothetical protein
MQANFGEYSNEGYNMARGANMQGGGNDYTAEDE